jgi:hypothetical protein
MSLSFSHQVNIIIQDSIVNTSFPLLSTIDNYDFISYINYSNHSIEFVEIPSLKKTNIYFSSKRNVPQSHIPINKDTVLLFYVIEGEFARFPMLIDKRGNSIEEYNFAKTFEKDRKILMYPSLSPIHLEGIKLYVTFNDYPFPMDSTFFSHTYTHIAEIDLNNKSFNEVDINYPKNYKDKLWRTNLDWCRGKNKEMVYSFSSSSFIVVEDSLKNKIFYNANTKHIDTIPPMASWENVEIKISYMRTTPFYKEILYDKYRNLYYRIAKSYKKKNLPRYTLIILNEHFTKLGEADFPFYTTNDNRSIPLIGKDGIYFRKLDATSNNISFYVYLLKY